MADLLAAYLLAQLETREAIQGARRALWERYREALAPWAERRGVQLPHVPRHVTPSHHLFHLVMPAASDRQGFIAHLHAHGIQAVFHYVPLHLSEMGRRFGGRAGDCPVAESVSDRLVRLPFFASLSAEDAQ